MSSKVEIANMALSYLGEETILAFTDESDQAKAINLHYLQSKRYLLMQHNWWFASLRKTLDIKMMEDPEDPPNMIPVADPKWDYVYAYPVDALKMLRIDEPERERPWQRFKDEIRSMASPFSCEYIQDVDELYFPPAFEEAFIFYLASKVAMAITGDRQVKKEASDMYAQSIQFAIAANDLEQGIQTLGELDGKDLRRGFYSLGRTGSGRIG